MAWFFGDGFDTYQQFSDAFLGGSYWDSGTATAFELSKSGRFAKSRGLIASQSSNTVVGLAKSSGSNDAVHHFNVAYYQSSTLALSGTTRTFAVTLLDGTTAQCTLNFRSDGAILLYSGAANTTATLLDTYTGAVTATNTWNSFEIEVAINNATGSFKVRKNGNTSDDHSATGLNTRGGTANNYANKIQLYCMTTSGNFTVDDFLWRSDTSSVAWAGDTRCNTRLPAADGTVQFTRSGSVAPVTPFVQGFTASIASNTARYMPFVAPCSGTVSTVILSLAATVTGSMKCTIFADTGTGPGAVLGSATALVNPTAGNNTFTFGSPPSVVQGTTYWVGYACSANSGTWNLSTNNFAGAYTSSGVWDTAATVYANFPVANVGVSQDQLCPISTVNITPTTASNAMLVADPTQDGAGGYVLDSTPGDTDLYTLQSISGTPTSILAVTTRMLAQKSDAGSRTAALVLKSGATTSAGSTVALNTTFGYIFRTDTVDPATGAAWTATAVNNLQVGPKVVA